METGVSSLKTKLIVIRGSDSAFHGKFWHLYYYGRGRQTARSQYSVQKWYLFYKKELILSAKIHKLDVLIMERISTIIEIYKEYQDASTCVELLTNYRSHPKILEFPSKTFYKGLLKSAAPTKTIESLQKWKELKIQNFLSYSMELKERIFEKEICLPFLTALKQLLLLRWFQVY